MDLSLYTSQPQVKNPGKKRASSKLSAPSPDCKGFFCSVKPAESTQIIWGTDKTPPINPFLWERGVAHKQEEEIISATCRTEGFFPPADRKSANTNMQGSDSSSISEH